MMLIGNWGRRSLIVGSGRRGGKMGGRMAVVVKFKIWCMNMDV